MRPPLTPLIGSKTLGIGAACPDCQGVLRYLSNYSCVECAKAYGRAWRRKLKAETQALMDAVGPLDPPSTQTPTNQTPSNQTPKRPDDGARPNKNKTPEQG